MKKWKERGKRIAVMFLAATLIGSSVNAPTLTVKAEETESATTNPFTITGGTENSDFTFSQSDTTGATLTINTGTPLTISGGTAGSPITGQIVIASGVEADLTLNGLYLTGVGASPDDSSKNAVSAIDLTSTSELTLTLAANSENKLTGGTTPNNGIGGPGIHVPEGATLTIQGSGKLDVAGGSNMAGYSGNGGVGIGGANSLDGNGEACGTVVITSGTVSVTGGTSAYGIGGGWGATIGLMGTVIITGGTVTVAGGKYASCDIGGRNQTDSGVVIILVENATLNTKDNSIRSMCSASILPANDGYELSGQLTLPDFVSDYTIGKTLTCSSGSLTIPAKVTLNIEAGTTLSEGLSITNNGTVKIDCRNENYDTLAAAMQGSGTVDQVHDWSNKDGKCKNCETTHNHNDATDWANKDGVCITCGAQHEHAADGWTYALGAEQNIITATCKTCHKEVTITLVAPTNLTYTGTEKTVTVTRSLEGLLPTLPDVVYEGGRTNVGSHTATLTVGGATATLNFTIDPAGLTVEGTGTASGTYGDTLENLIVSGLTAKLNAETVPGTWALTGDTVPNVGDSGTYTSAFTPESGEGNYNPLTAQVKLDIQKRPITVKLQDQTVLVGGTAPTVALTYEGLVKDDTVEFTPEFTLTDKDGNPLKGENDTELTFAEALAKAVSTVGSYNIKWTNAEELVALNDTDTGNYTFTVMEGGNTATLTVNSRSSSGNSGGGTVLPPTETDTVIKPDGTKVETTTETGKDGTKVETITETKTDGTKKETITETGKDGSVKTTETLTKPDGSVTSVTEKTVIPESSSTTSTTVTVKKDGEGEIVSAKATVTKTVNAGSKATIQSAVLEQIIEAAGTEDVTITMTVKDAEGKTKYTVKADAGDFEPGNELYIYKYDIRAKEYTLVNAKTYTVNKAGNVSVSMKIKATYYLVDSEEAAEINQKIVSTVKPKKSKATVKKGKSVTFTLSDKVNEDNIKSITYTTTKKSVATVGKKGKVSAKKKGTVVVKAKVTLKNGMTKTIKMTIKVK